MKNNQSRIVKELKYHGLGFLVILKDVEVTTIDGEDYYNINMKALKECMLDLLMKNHEIAITGSILRFVRKSVNLSLEELGNELGKAKSTISKWEKKKEEIINLNNNEKFLIKQLIYEYKMDKDKRQLQKVLMPKKKEEKPRTVKSTRNSSAIKIPSSSIALAAFCNQYA